jgi:DNA-binding HxlR family transcriptional regulator
VNTDLAGTLDVVGDRWALLLVREVSLGLHRFDDLQASTGAPRAVLSDRLRRLSAAGILTTRAYRAPRSRERLEYVLTDAGLDLLPLLAALTDWHARHRQAGSPSEVDYRHVACGGQVRAQLVCDCGQQVSPHDRLVAQVNR